MHSLATPRRHIVSALTAVLVALATLVPAGSLAEIDRSRVETRTSADAPLVYHYVRQYEPAIDMLDESSDRVVEGLSEQLGIESFPEVEVWLLPKVNDYFAIKGEPDRAPDWAIGLSLGSSHTVIVARDTELPGQTETSLEKTFIHELAHVAVDIARGEGRVPRWFNEGFALTHAREWTPQRSERLAKAASTGALLSLEELDGGFPSHRNVASLAYAQSFHFVRYLKERFGPSVTAEIMKGVREGESFDAAVEGATGHSLAAIDADWRGAVTDQTSWLALLRDDFTIFFGVAFLFVIAWFVRRRRNNQRRAAADDEEGEWSYDKSRYPLPGEPRE